jgi:hypothetical protein
MHAEGIFGPTGKGGGRVDKTAKKKKKDLHDL